MLQTFPFVINLFGSVKKSARGHPESTCTGWRVRTFTLYLKITQMSQNIWNECVDRIS